MTTTLETGKRLEYIPFTRERWAIETEKATGEILWPSFLRVIRSGPVPNRLLLQDFEEKSYFGEMSV